MFIKIGIEFLDIMQADQRVFMFDTKIQTIKMRFL